MLDVVRHRELGHVGAVRAVVETLGGFLSGTLNSYPHSYPRNAPAATSLWRTLRDVLSIPGDGFGALMPSGKVLDSRTVALSSQAVPTQ
jgi:hypothetical protein